MEWVTQRWGKASAFSSLSRIDFALRPYPLATSCCNAGVSQALRELSVETLC